MGQLDTPDITGLNYQILAPGILSFEGALPWAKQLGEDCVTVGGWKSFMSERQRYQTLIVSGAFDGRLAEYEGALMKLVGNLLQAYNNYNSAVASFCDVGYHALKFGEGDYQSLKVDASSIQEDASCQELMILIGCSETEACAGAEIQWPIQNLSLRVPLGTAVIAPAGIHFPYSVAKVESGMSLLLATWAFRFLKA